MRLMVNGASCTVDASPRWTLADVLREGLGLTGTNVGCEQGICGACTVLVDGLPARACLMLAGQADGRRVETVEGLGTEEAPHVLQEEFSRRRALQCGFCTPGFLMAAAGLLRERPHAGAEDIAEAVAGSLCRCTGYLAIHEAVTAAVVRLAGAAERPTVNEAKP